MIHYDGTADADITYKNCTIIGWAAIGGKPNSLTFDGCSIYGNGSWGCIRVYGYTTVKNCTNVNGAIYDIFNISSGGSFVKK